MTPKYFKTLGQSVFAALLLAAGMGSANAAVEQYYYTITGDVLDDFGSVWGLSAGDIITADISFQADLGGTETGSNIVVDTIFIRLPGDVAWPNYMTINESDMDGDVLISLDNGVLTDFSFFTLSFDFNSNFTSFDDGDFNMFGDWRTNVVQNAVPVPAAVWLFGSALLGMVGWARRKRAV